MGPLQLDPGKVCTPYPATPRRLQNVKSLTVCLDRHTTPVMTVIFEGRPMSSRAAARLALKRDMLPHEFLASIPNHPKPWSLRSTYSQERTKAGLEKLRSGRRPDVMKANARTTEYLQRVADARGWPAEHAALALLDRIAADDLADAVLDDEPPNRSR